MDKQACIKNNKDIMKNFPYLETQNTAICTISSFLISQFVKDLLAIVQERVTTSKYCKQKLRRSKKF